MIIRAVNMGRKAGCEDYDYSGSEHGSDDGKDVSDDSDDSKGLPTIIRIFTNLQFSRYLNFPGHFGISDVATDNQQSFLATHHTHHHHNSTSTTSPTSPRSLFTQTVLSRLPSSTHPVPKNLFSALPPPDISLSCRCFHDSAGTPPLHVAMVLSMIDVATRATMQRAGVPVSRWLSLCPTLSLWKPTRAGASCATHHFGGDPAISTSTITTSDNFEFIS
jgi:hypothetical protein